jgi:purine-nucleoside phosphorylase
LVLKAIFWGEHFMAEEILTSTEVLYERVEHAARIIRTHWKEEARIGVVLGSGLGALVDVLEEKVIVPYEDVPGFPTLTVEGHQGRLALGKVDSIPVVILQGRAHYYEGKSMEEVTFPIRVLGLLGIRSLILTNAAGGINVSFDQGSLMLISDHLNLMGVNPLLGSNDNRFGPRFPDMTEVYSHEYQEIVIEEAHEIGLDLRRGVYAAVSGPNYETPAEVRLLRTLGADAVGMSTVPEAIVASHMGMKVLGISCITNMAAGVLNLPINHEEVLETGKHVSKQFIELLSRVIPRIGK